MCCCLLKMNVSPNDATLSVVKPGVDILQNYYHMPMYLFSAHQITQN